MGQQTSATKQGDPKSAKQLGLNSHFLAYKVIIKVSPISLEKKQHHKITMKH